MAFDSLSEKLQSVMKKLTGKGKLNEADVKAAMREVRMALLEADVNFGVAKDFCSRVSQKAVGEEILKSLTPGQQVVKIVRDELVSLMGGTNAKLAVSSAPPTVIMLCGLQGAGKTTMCGKLAGYLAKQGKKPLLVACDIYRPAAISQLQVVAKAFNIPVFEKGTQDPVKTVKEAIAHAKSYQHDTVIIDTAGRLHIDEQLMSELQRMVKVAQPSEILLTVDAMTGQDAVNVAKSFDEQLSLTGVILTKLDGDTRGGAALSVKAVTGKPIKFCGVGEKISLDCIEPFHPERMASRILGMGDVLSLIEKAQEAIDDETVAKMEERLRTQQFDLQDYLEQLQQMKKMGNVSDLLDMMPGVDKSKLREEDLDMKRFDRMAAIICSMTKKERRNPGIINGQRRKRIAAGSGTTVQEVNILLKQFDQTKQMMKHFSKMKKGRMRFPF
ncbi:MAG: signal recognition particle protein [Clostridia bacterium]|nr:signal recognition particle protein [Clostridia bacterium]